MVEVERITSEYNAQEDRFCLTSETGDGKVVSLWITQRLLVLVIPHLLDWLANQSPESTHNPSKDADANAFLQGLAQKSATQSLLQEETVSTAKSSQGWLVHEVDITKVPAQGVRLIFKSIDGEEVGLNLEKQQLRQWLTIVFAQWQQAQWLESIWPDWISGSATNIEVSEPSASEEVH